MGEGEEKEDEHPKPRHEVAGVVSQLKRDYERLRIAHEFQRFVRIERDLRKALSGADAVMLLRIQHERMSASDALDKESFNREWGISSENLRHARPDAIVMHPGPMNRGVEITSEVADGPHSVIRQQVTNGVAIRMAVLYLLAGGAPERAEAAKQGGEA
jgi:aspartate carbamoyltransferase catalytic subunit